MVSRLTREIAFYRKFHRDTVNVGLHIVGIPTILATSLYNLTPIRLSWYPELSFGFLVGMYYWYYYTRLDPKFGFPLGAVIAGSSYIFGKLSAENPRFGLTWALWTLGWVGQFVGHGIFEKRAPALFDNLQQALLLAPFFAVLEIAAFLGVGHAQRELDKVDMIKPESKKKK